MWRYYAQAEDLRRHRAFREAFCSKVVNYYCIYVQEIQSMFRSLWALDKIMALTHISCVRHAEFEPFLLQALKLALRPFISDYYKMAQVMKEDAHALRQLHYDIISKCLKLNVSQTHNAIYEFYCQDLSDNIDAMAIEISSEESTRLLDQIRPRLAVLRAFELHFVKDVVYFFQMHQMNNGRSPSSLLRKAVSTICEMQGASELADFKTLSAEHTTNRICLRKNRSMTFNVTIDVDFQLELVKKDHGRHWKPMRWQELGWSEIYTDILHANITNSVARCRLLDFGKYISAEICSAMRSLWAYYLLHEGIGDFTFDFYLDALLRILVVTMPSNTLLQTAKILTKQAPALSNLQMNIERNCCQKDAAKYHHLLSEFEAVSTSNVLAASTTLLQTSHRPLLGKIYDLLNDNSLPEAPSITLDQCIEFLARHLQLHVIGSSYPSDLFRRVYAAVFRSQDKISAMTGLFRAQQSKVTNFARISQTPVLGNRVRCTSLLHSQIKPEGIMILFPSLFQRVQGFVGPREWKSIDWLGPYLTAWYQKETITESDHQEFYDTRRHRSDIASYGSECFGYVKSVHAHLWSLQIHTVYLYAQEAASLLRTLWILYKIACEHGTMSVDRDSIMHYLRQIVEFTLQLHGNHTVKWGYRMHRTATAMRALHLSLQSLCLERDAEQAMKLWGAPDVTKSAKFTGKANRNVWKLTQLLFDYKVASIAKDVLLQFDSSHDNGMFIGMILQVVDTILDYRDYSWKIFKVADLSKLKCVGQGGYGIVFKCHHNGRLVAVKVFNESVGLGDFLREMSIWQNLSNKPNINALLGGSSESMPRYAVTAYHRHGHVRDYLSRSSAGIDRLKLMREIVSGILWLHSSDVIHGDIKAANVLIDKNGTALISDFGTSKIRAKVLQDHSSHKLKGSIRWMAPEMIANASATKKSDIYAIAMTFWEIITLKLPFDDIDNMHVRHAILSDVRPKQLPFINVDLWTIMQECWDRDPRKRHGIITLQAKLNRLASWLRSTMQAPRQPEDDTEYTQLLTVE